MAFRLDRIDRLPLVWRIVIAVAIVVCTILFLMALTRLLDAEPKEPDLYANIPRNEELLEIDESALIEAYHAHVVKLFTVWLTDGAKDASRFQNGLRITRQAYDIAKRQIENRKQR